SAGAARRRASSSSNTTWTWSWTCATTSSSSTSARSSAPVRRPSSRPTPPSRRPTWARPSRRPPVSDTPILQIENLSTYYGAVQALRSVDLTVRAGEICAVLGANGAGKTTLLRTVSGLQPAAPGSRVRVDGVDITRHPAESMVRHGLAHVPEGGGVIVELTVEENLRLGGLWRADRRDRAKALDEVYDLFPPLEERRDRHAGTLSGGERQMVEIG